MNTKTLLGLCAASRAAATAFAADAPKHNAKPEQDFVPDATTATVWEPIYPTDQIMRILFVIVFLGLSSWALVALFRRLRRQQASSSLWYAFGILVACGLALGIWCAFYCEYGVDRHYRARSFPIPVVVVHPLSGGWLRVPAPKLQGWAAVITNVITITALATLPLWLRLGRQHRDENRVVDSGSAA